MKVGLLVGQRTGSMSVAVPNNRNSAVGIFQNAEFAHAGIEQGYDPWSQNYASVNLVEPIGL